LNPHSPTVALPQERETQARTNSSTGQIYEIEHKGERSIVESGKNLISRGGVPEDRLVKTGHGIPDDEYVTSEGWTSKSEKWQWRSLL
jgi:hypothetical protein